MTHHFANAFGYAAAALTTLAFVPQAWQSWRTRNLSGISLPMYALFTLGVALWLCYGILIDSLPVLIANGVTLCLSSVVLWLKIQAVCVGRGLPRHRAAEGSRKAG
jgi:MtN3 and saliva related transmembrane protein